MAARADGFIQKWGILIHFGGANYFGKTKNPAQGRVFLFNQYNNITLPVRQLVTWYRQAIGPI